MALKKLTTKEASDLIKSGEVVAYPTEAVFGLGCDPFNQAAFEKLLHLKRRAPNKGVILVGAQWAHLAPLIGELPKDTYVQIRESWPAPITWIVPASPLVPEWIKGEYPTVALRQSAHPTVVSLCNAFGGPVVSTSANLSSQPPERTWEGVEATFKEGLAGVICELVGGEDKPTQIFDAISKKRLR